MLVVPVDATGADALFDAFTTLPGLGAQRLLAARQGSRVGEQVLWRRASPLALTPIEPSGHVSASTHPERESPVHVHSPIRRRPDRASRSAGRISRLGLQAQGRLAHRHRAREIRLLPRHAEPLPYEGARSIKAVLEGLRDRFGWELVARGRHHHRPGPRTARMSALSPAVRWNCRARRLETIHQTCDEVNEHLREVREVADEHRRGIHRAGRGPDLAARGHAADAQGALSS